MLSLPRSLTSARFLRRAKVEHGLEAAKEVRWDGRRSPDGHELVGAESGLAKDFLCHATGQEAAALLVPRAKDLIVPLLFFRREFPRDRNARLTELSLVVLLELLLQ